MENITLFVLGIIILANIVGIVTVLRIGSGHDAHQDVSSPESSQALARIYANYALPEPAERALPASTEPTDE